MKKAKEKKTSNEEFEEEIAPSEKKSRKEKATESRVSIRGAGRFGKKMDLPNRHNAEMVLSIRQNLPNNFVIILFLFI